jgi:hypothetical protein
LFALLSFPPSQHPFLPPLSVSTTPSPHYSFLSLSLL